MICWLLFSPFLLLVLFKCDFLKQMKPSSYSYLCLIYIPMYRGLSNQKAQYHRLWRIQVNEVALFKIQSVYKMYNSLLLPIPLINQNQINQQLNNKRCKYKVNVDKYSLIIIHVTWCLFDSFWRRLKCKCLTFVI